MLLSFIFLLPNPSEEFSIHHWPLNVAVITTDNLVLGLSSTFASVFLPSLAYCLSNVIRSDHVIPGSRRHETQAPYWYTRLCASKMMTSKSFDRPVANTLPTSIDKSVRSSTPTKTPYPEYSP